MKAPVLAAAAVAALLAGSAAAQTTSTTSGSTTTQDTTAPLSTGAAQTADTPAGQPPSTYPVCTHKGEDRCVERSEMKARKHK